MLCAVFSALPKLLVVCPMPKSKINYVSLLLGDAANATVDADLKYLLKQARLGTGKSNLSHGADLRTGYTGEQRYQIARILFDYLQYDLTDVPTTDANPAKTRRTRREYAARALAQLLYVDAPNKWSDGLAQRRDNIRDSFRVTDREIARLREALETHNLMPRKESNRHTREADVQYGRLIEEIREIPEQAQRQAQLCQLYGLPQSAAPASGPAAPVPSKFPDYNSKVEAMREVDCGSMLRAIKYFEDYFIKPWERARTHKQCQDAYLSKKGSDAAEYAGLNDAVYDLLAFYSRQEMITQLITVNGHEVPVYEFLRQALEEDGVSNKQRMINFMSRNEIIFKMIRDADVEDMFNGVRLSEADKALKRTALLENKYKALKELKKRLHKVAEDLHLPKNIHTVTTGFKSGKGKNKYKDEDEFFTTRIRAYQLTSEVEADLAGAAAGKDFAHFKRKTLTAPAPGHDKVKTRRRKSRIRKAGWGIGLFVGLGQGAMAGTFFRGSLGILLALFGVAATAATANPAFIAIGIGGAIVMGLAGSSTNTYLYFKGAYDFLYMLFFDRASFWRDKKGNEVGLGMKIGVGLLFSGAFVSSVFSAALTFATFVFPPAALAANPLLWGLVAVGVGLSAYTLFANLGLLHFDLANTLKNAASDFRQFVQEYFKSDQHSIGRKIVFALTIAVVTGLMIYACISMAGLAMGPMAAMLMFVGNTTSISPLVMGITTAVIWSGSIVNAAFMLRGAITPSIKVANKLCDAMVDYVKGFADFKGKTLVEGLKHFGGHVVLKCPLLWPATIPVKLAYSGIQKLVKRYGGRHVTKTMVEMHDLPVVPGGGDATGGVAATAPVAPVAPVAADAAPDADGTPVIQTPEKAKYVNLYNEYTKFSDKAKLATFGTAAFINALGCAEGTIGPKGVKATDMALQRNAPRPEAITINLLSGGLGSIVINMNAYLSVALKGWILQTEGNGVELKDVTAPNDAPCRLVSDLAPQTGKDEPAAEPAGGAGPAAQPPTSALEWAKFRWFEQPLTRLQEAAMAAETAAPDDDDAPEAPQVGVADMQFVSRAI
jgi:hypothetical protein